MDTGDMARDAVLNAEQVEEQYAHMLQVLDGLVPDHLAATQLREIVRTVDKLRAEMYKQLDVVLDAAVDAMEIKK